MDDKAIPVPITTFAAAFNTINATYKQVVLRRKISIFFNTNDTYYSGFIVTYYGEKSLINNEEKADLLYQFRTTVELPLPVQ